MCCRWRSSMACVRLHVPLRNHPSVTRSTGLTGGDGADGARCFRGAPDGCHSMNTPHTPDYRPDEDDRDALPTLFMRLALREARRALAHEDVPIGAVIVHEGEVIARGPQRARAARRRHRPRRDRRDARGLARARLLAPARLHALRDARAVRDVRRGDRARAAPALVFGADRPQGGRVRQRARRARATPASTIAPRFSPGCSRPTAASC